MKALSIKQPWAYLIASGTKGIENRTWKCPEKYIGQRVLIHASAMPCLDIYSLFSDTQKTFIFNNPQKSTIENIRAGVDVHNACKTVSAIIGSVEIVACVVNHSSIWAEKTKLPTVGDVLEDIHFLGKVQNPDSIIYNWMLANPILFEEPIMNVKGKLGFWEYEDL